MEEYKEMRIIYPFEGGINLEEIEIFSSRLENQLEPPIDFSRLEEKAVKKIQD